MLEARENAEIIWFPVVWEEVEDASNVIDYNIREEQTKDTFAQINANNQTTTGMATVIPWINAPKLIASTSVTWIPDEEPEWSFYWTYVAAGSTPTVSIDTWETTDPLNYTMTESSNTLPFSWTINNKWVVFPRAWWYSVVIRYMSMGQEEYRRTDTLYLNSTVVDTTSSIYNSTDHTITFNAKKWDVLWCTTEIYSSIPRTSTKSANIRFTITPK